MKIRPALIKDLAEIKKLTEACAVAMQEKNIFQWNEYYPSREKLKADISKKELYVLEENAEIIGIIVLSDFMDEEYIPVEWLTRTGKNLYIHRLATHPSVWGMGYGQKLMDFAENFARKNGFESVRLDTFSQNKRNHRFYESRGYKRLGDIYFPKQSEDPFHCYELVF
jgi:ribosomal protein S18 acetylase RimI-like enzyme